MRVNIELGGNEIGVVPGDRPKLGAGVPLGIVETRPRLLKTAILRAQLLRLALRGLTASQSAEIIGCSVFTARSHYRDTSFREQVMSRVEGALAYADERFADQQKSLHVRLAEKSEKAFDVLVEMLEDSEAKYDANLRFRVAREFLDRNPETAGVSKVDHSHAHRFLPDELARAAATAVEMNKKVISIKAG